MSEECNHNCSECSENCDSRENIIPKENVNKHSKVRKTIGIVSGKGGVGKSLVTCILATVFKRREFNVAILDADVTGPSIPKAFGLGGKKVAESEFGMIPVKSKSGIDIMSVNLLLQNETDPVVWRGPIIAGTVKQFYTDSLWQDIDYMFIDMPPGTGDVALTVFQSIPVDGIIIVTSPQELVSMIVGKAINMAKLMDIPVLGIVENMSYFKCPDCSAIHYIFGKSNLEDIAKQYGVDVLDRLPVDPEISKNIDDGLIELYEGEYLGDCADAIEKKLG